VRTAKKIEGELTSDPGPLAKLLDPLRLESRKIGFESSRKFRRSRNREFVTTLGFGEYVVIFSNMSTF